MENWMDINGHILFLYDTHINQKFTNFPLKSFIFPTSAKIKIEIHNIPGEIHNIPGEIVRSGREMVFQENINPCKTINA